jgi:hypothetical protein
MFGSRFGGLRGLRTPVLLTQHSQRRHDRRQFAQTPLSPSLRQRRVLGCLDQVRPAFGERPFDRPPLLSPALDLTLGLREIS